MITNSLPDLNRLNELLTYDSFTGVAVWKARNGDQHAKRWNGRHAGKPAGGRVGEYLTVSIDDCNYLLHRVIFKIMTGREPVMVDHINGVKTDNRWCNLREASSTQNRCNTGVTVRSRSGVKGVGLKKNGMWQGIVNHQRKTYRTAFYPTLDQAAEETKKLREQIHGAFAKN